MHTNIKNIVLTIKKIQNEGLMKLPTYELLIRI